MSYIPDFPETLPRNLRIAAIQAWEETKRRAELDSAVDLLATELPAPDSHGPPFTATASPSFEVLPNASPIMASPSASHAASSPYPFAPLRPGAGVQSTYSCSHI